MDKLVNFTLLNENFNDFEYFIVDAKVESLYREDLKFLDGKKVFLVESPEESKNLSVYNKAISYFIENGIKRNSTIVVFGGGATSDLGGFVASTILRGVKWIVVPTTLLAMIDASIGGKVGINTSHGKNLIGSFHKPLKTYIVLDFLKTLPVSEYQSGLGEMTKYLFIDEKLNYTVNQDKLISLCAALKEEIVENDFKEEGLREVLNFGHTFGHAIESMTKLSHGQSVLLGIKLNIQLFSPELISYFNEVISHFKLDTPIIKLDIDKFIEILSFDKKNTETGEVRFITFTKRGSYKNTAVKSEKLKENLINLESYENFFS